jgi:hypothetical protein
MRSVTGAVTIAAMTERLVAKLQLELILDSDPIAGCLRAEGDDGRQFSGWIELTRVIELGLDDARRAHPPGNTVPPGRIP